jgi:two-component system nitrogen regulation response regulator NtrX
MFKAKILVVDDEEDILNTLSGSLEDEGYEVWTARDGAEAMQLVRTRHPDIIFLDIWLPGMDGIQTLKAIKEFDTDIEVVIMTGHGTVNTAVQAIKLGAADFLEKPLSLDAVLETIRRIVEQTLLQREGGPETRLRAPRRDELIGNSRAVRELRKETGRLGKVEGPVLIVGEPGTGKELVARILHDKNHGRRRPLIKFACTIWPEEELEEEIFGAAPNGSAKRMEARKSLFEQASGKILYLDAINEIPLSAQKRLAEYLKERKKARSAPSGLPRGPVRIIASTTKDLDRTSREGLFSEELLACFKGRILKIQPLSERKSDIPELTQFFLKTLCMDYGRKPKEIDDEALQTLVSFDWPGNVKELKNIVERMVISVPISRITYKDIPPSIRNVTDTQHEAAGSQTHEMWDSYQEASDSWEKDYLLYHIKKHEGDLRKTAKALHMDPRRLARKADKLGLLDEPEPSKPVVRQRTLRRSVVLAGQGLHSGVKTGLILTPLPPNSGILFGNISTGEVVPVHIDYVESTGYATCLRKGTTSAKTTEHFLAVLHSYRISNLLVKINDELPIMDGSALDFCAIVEDAGIEEQDDLLNEIIIDKKFVIGDEGPDSKFMQVEPSDHFQVDYILDYPEPVGRQEVNFVLKNAKAFKELIAPARTFGFVKDIEKLESMGLASGGKLTNVILVDEEKVVNTTLRFPDEFARHKILDILGDFYLLGRPIRGKITAQMTGHSENVAMMKMIREQMKIV